MPVGRILLSVLAATALLIAATAARASSRPDPKIEAQYESEIPGKASQFHAATAAREAGNMAETEKWLREVLTAYPQHGPTLWRLAGIVSQRGAREEAIALARKAVAVRPDAASRTTLADVLMSGSPTSPELAEVDGILADAGREASDARAKTYVAVSSIQLAIKRNNIPAFREAVEQLQLVAPDEMATHYFSALDAAAHGDQDGAAREIDRAVALGLPAAEAERLRDSFGINRQKQLWHWAQLGAGLLVVWLATLLLLYAVGSLLSGLTLKAVDRFDGRDSNDLRARTSALRGWYRRTVGFAAVYYFVSIPVVIGVVLLVAGGILYGFLLIGQLPIKLLFIVGAVALVSVWSMLKSLIIRRKADEDPGRRLPESEAPALWAVLREVAQKVGTRAVDSVFLTVGTEMAVIERGSMSERLRDRGQRSLILGVGLLSGFSRAQFRAVLAHEYGHFSNRDTAGGNTGLVVQASLLKSILGIARGGGAAFYNPAWLFMRGFYLLFLRITLGASRLQEIMADHFAAVAYGAAAFRDGLTHVVRRTLEFDRSADLLVNAAQKIRRPMANLYVAPEGGLSGAGLETAFREAMNQKGSPYDSHPPPARRLAWVARVESPSDAPSDDGPVWALFTAQAALEAEMTAIANHRLLAQRLIDDPDDEALPAPAAE